MVTIQDEVTLEYEAATLAQYIQTQLPTMEIDLTSSSQGTDLSAGSISAMTKISASMINHQEATLKL